HLGAQQWSEIKDWLQAEAQSVCDVLLLQETHWSSTAQFQVSGWTCISSASWKPQAPEPKAKTWGRRKQSQAPETVTPCEATAAPSKADGVVVLLSPRIDTGQVRWREHRDRSSLLAALSKAVRQVPSRMSLVVAGDLNATLSPYPRLVGPRACGATQRPDSEGLQELVETHKLVALNTWHAAVPHTYTQQGSLSQIDFIFTKETQAGGQAKRAAPLHDWHLGSWKVGGHSPVLATVKPLGHWQLPSRKDTSTCDVKQLQSAVREDSDRARQMRDWVRDRMPVHRPDQCNQILTEAAELFFPKRLMGPAEELAVLGDFAVSTFGVQTERAVPKGSAPAAAWKLCADEVSPSLSAFLTTVGEERPDAKGVAGAARELSPGLQSYMREIPQFAYLPGRALSDARARLVTEVETTTGIKQGCKLAPSLFSLLTGKLIKEPIEFFGEDRVCAFLTGYADDLTVHRTIRSIADLEACHALIRAVLESLKDHKLVCNQSKCYILAKFARRQAASVTKQYTAWTRNEAGERIKLWRIGKTKYFPAFRWVPTIKFLGIKASYGSFEMQTLTFRISEVGLTLESAKSLKAWYAFKIRSVLNKPAHETHMTTGELYELYSIEDPVVKLERLQSNRFYHLNAQQVLSPSITNTGEAIQQSQEQLSNLRQFMHLPETEAAEGTPVVACQHCDRSFVSEQGLRLHRAKQHPDVVERYVPEWFDRAKHSVNGLPTCRACGTQFKQWPGLLPHLLSGELDATKDPLALSAPLENLKRAVALAPRRQLSKIASGQDAKVYNKSKHCLQCPIKSY
ncbi:unnamed protein product, partial [Symbiodinium pilosum]